MPVGSYDPDSEEGQVQRPAWSRPKDDLDKSALEACGRKYFKTSEERKAWKALREKALGATDEKILFEEWIKHNIKLCAEANKKARRTERIFPTLLRMIANSDRRVDWEAANRETILQNRLKGVEELLFKDRE